MENKNKTDRLTDDQIKLIWWLHEAEQLKEKLSNDEVDQINDYIRNHPGSEMWEIENDE
jgi:hypothetical protein